MKDIRTPWRVGSVRRFDGHPIFTWVAYVLDAGSDTIAETYGFNEKDARDRATVIAASVNVGENLVKLADIRSDK